ncbi:MAG: response regulator [Nitrospirota bacterium]
MAKPGQPPSAQPSPPETILLVDDDKALRDVTRKTLQQRGYMVLFAGDGEAALRVCKQHIDPIHLLLTDVVMPGGMSGPALADHIVSLRPNIRILYTSGYTDAVTIPGGLCPGVGFLVKPFTAEALTRKVREILDQPV